MNEYSLIRHGSKLAKKICQYFFKQLPTLYIAIDSVSHPVC